MHELAEVKYWRPTKPVSALLILSLGYCALTWVYVWFFSGVVAPSTFEGLVSDIMTAIGGSTAIFTAILITVKEYQRAYTLSISFLIIFVFNVGTLPLSTLLEFPVVAIVVILSVMAHAWQVYTSITYRDVKNTPRKQPPISSVLALGYASMR